VFIDALDQADQKYKAKDIRWVDGEPDLASEENFGKVVVYAFMDDKEPSKRLERNLAHPWIAKDHDRMIFVKNIGRDNDLAKRFQVATIPTLVFYAPVLKESERVVDRKGGELPLRSIRHLQKRSFELVKRELDKPAK
jgi:thioredoxin-like negative regulator of GroEL